MRADLPRADRFQIPIVSSAPVRHVTAGAHSGRRSDSGEAGLSARPHPAPGFGHMVAGALGIIEAHSAHALQSRFVLYEFGDSLDIERLRHPANGLEHGVADGIASDA